MWEKQVPTGSGGGGVGGDPRNITYVEVLSEATQNLFDKTTIETGGYYDQPSGAWSNDPSLVSSSLIPVTAGQTYTRTTSTGIINTLWSSAGAYVGYNRSKTFTIPATGVSRVRLAIKPADVDAEMFVLGSTQPTPYQPYGETPVYKFPSKTFVSEIRPKAINSTHLSDEANTYLTREIQDYDRLERARGKVNLFVETVFDGYNQPIHPKILSFSTAWNGYKYWLAYTPYPFAKANSENPAIAASNDMLNWVTPAGMATPLLDDLTDATQSYWSDTHLVYRPDLNRLECWYRGIQEVGVFPANKVTIARRTTTDGINWTAREVIYTLDGAGFVSHAVIWDAVATQYKAWVFQGGGGVFDISANALTWTKIGNISYYTAGATSITVWHGDVIKTDVGYEMVAQPDTNNCAVIQHYISDDGLVWRDRKDLIRKNDLYGIDSGGFYRPSLMKANGIYYLCYSTISTTGVRGLSLSVASVQNDIYSLRGIDAESQQFMAKPTKKSRWMRLGTTFHETSLNKLVTCTSEGTSAVNAVFKDVNGTIV